MVFSLLTGGSSSTKKNEIETNRHTGKDYDEGPTVLYSLIEKRDWKGCVLRCQKAPVEASTWIYRNEKGTNQLRWRQLPIHAAIIFGATTEVLEMLFEKCPNGAEMQDDQGMTPLHLAFRHDSPEVVIDLLLNKYPDAANLRDRKGRVPITLVHVAAEGEPSTLRTYMANFIMERSTVVAAQHKEKQMREMTEAYTEEIRTLAEEREKEKEVIRCETVRVQRELINASAHFKKWAAEEDVTPMDAANQNHTVSSTHDSITSTIEIFANRVSQMEEVYETKISNLMTKHGEFVSGLDKEYKKQIEDLTSKSSNAIEQKESLNKDNHAKIVSLSDQLSVRNNEYDVIVKRLEETKKDSQGYVENNAVLTTKVEMHENTIKELQNELTSGKNFHEETKKILTETLTKVNDLEHDKSTLEDRNETLSKQYNELKIGSSSDKQELKDDVKKLEEELELANEALNQASETVQTLEDQMAKLYVEKEELKTNFFNLQQTSTDNQESQQVYIQELEAENEAQKAAITEKNAEIEDLTQKFDGLSTLRDRENEIAINKETALGNKMNEMMSRYEEFQQQIESFNERTVEYDADLEQFKEANEKLSEQLEEERLLVDDQQKQILRARESEAVHIERGQDLAKKLAKVTTEMKKVQDDFAKEKLRLETVNVQLVDESKSKVELLEQIMKQTQHVSDTLTRRCDDYENENMSLRKSLEEMAKRVVRTSLARTGSTPGTQVKGAKIPTVEEVLKSAEIDNVETKSTKSEGTKSAGSGVPAEIVEPTQPLNTISSGQSVASTSTEDIRKLSREIGNFSSAHSVTSTATEDILKPKKLSREIDNIQLNKNIADMKAEIEKITSSIMN